MKVKLHFSGKINGMEKGFPTERGVAKDMQMAVLHDAFLNKSVFFSSRKKRPGIFGVRLFLA
jgi:hypothetical protein